jgi:hypothetical protein
LIFHIFLIKTELWIVGVIGGGGAEEERNKQQNMEKLSNHRHIAEHFPGTVTDFTACSLPPPSAFTIDLLPKSDDVVLFYFISPRLQITPPRVQITFYLPPPSPDHFL